MSIPTGIKDQAIYHTILSDLHRMQAILFNMRVLSEPSTAAALREHFAREQSVTLGKLSEWRQRRPDIYREAQSDFQRQVRPPEPGAEATS